jgi:deazaflavin-dependent oxidoreductase (nitroreductase family)
MRAGKSNAEGCRGATVAASDIVGWTRSRGSMSRRGPSRDNFGLVNPLLQLFVGAHVRVYRLTGGRLGSKIVGLPVVLLTTTGRKTGKSRTVPLASFDDGGDRIIVASAGGSPTHPAWYNNLTANPDVTVQFGPRVYSARAETVTGDERARLWKLIISQGPNFADYEKKAAGRTIPVVRLKEARA